MLPHSHNSGPSGPGIALMDHRVPDIALMDHMVAWYRSDGPFASGTTLKDNLTTDITLADQDNLYSHV